MGARYVAARDVTNGDVSCTWEFAPGQYGDAERTFAAENLHAILAAVEMDVAACAARMVVAGAGRGNGDQQIYMRD